MRRRRIWLWPCTAIGDTSITTRPRKELMLAEKGLPNNANVVSLQAYIDRRQGHWDKATNELLRASDLEPTRCLYSTRSSADAFSCKGVLPKWRKRWTGPCHHSATCRGANLTSHRRLRAHWRHATITRHNRRDGDGRSTSRSAIGRILVSTRVLGARCKYHGESDRGHATRRHGGGFRAFSSILVRSRRCENARRNQPRAYQIPSGAQRNRGDRSATAEFSGDAFRAWESSTQI